jgi:hypothetical protein
MTVHVFGVRHFSPAAALQVGRGLDALDPDVVLIEGPADATDQLKHLADKRTRPPVALLAFTKMRPVRSIIYPMAAYSPEWVALRWALERKREVRFIDLPAAVFLALHQAVEQADEDGEHGEDSGDDGEGAAASSGTSPAAEEAPEPDDSQAYLDDPYQEIARIAGDPDHETWWERQFENLLEGDAFREAVAVFGRELRAVRADMPARAAENELREAHMRREIRAAATGRTTVAVVCGAYHASALGEDRPAMDDAAFTALPRAPIVITLMPYSYARLSAQSGYGAGNQAPAYYEALYEEALAGRPSHLGARHLANLARRLRAKGIVRSSAEVIEAVRLAEGLAAMNGQPVPVLRDYRDAAITLLGQGDRRVIEEALRDVEIGRAVGSLQAGVSRTALQDDFHQLIKTLRLERFLKDGAQPLELDLREDRRAKSAEAAFLDRSRSTFLHRLEVLGVGFAQRGARKQKGTAREAWTLSWSPECEIRLAECSLTADSIETGAAFVMGDRLGAAEDVGAATDVLLCAVDSELHDSLRLALRRVQDLAVEEAGFPAAAKGIQDLAEVIRYGNTREVDPAPLRPVLAQLYLRACLLAFGASACDADAAKAVRTGMDRIHAVAFLGEEGIDPGRWLAAVADVAESDSRNALLSGYATALLIERGKLDDEDLDREIARRLSPGTAADVGVNWFEGLVQRNRAALFLRTALWACLARYVEALTDEEFMRALLYLRRAFSTFTPGEVRRVVAILAELWQAGGQGGGRELAQAVERKLDASEIAEVADDLGGLDLI